MSETGPRGFQSTGVRLLHGELPILVHFPRDALPDARRAGFFGGRIAQVPRLPPML